jgi:hypothetical protein
MQKFSTGSFMACALATPKLFDPVPLKGPRFPVMALRDGHDAVNWSLLRHSRPERAFIQTNSIEMTHSGQLAAHFAVMHNCSPTDMLGCRRRRGDRMKCREFIPLLGRVALGWPIATHAQQLALPVIGLLCGGTPESDADRLTAFRRGLNEAGYHRGPECHIRLSLGRSAV